jgi:hypothetical protein
MSPTRFFHSVILGMACCANRIDFSMVGKIGPSDIAGLCAQRGFKLGVIMGGEPEGQARVTNCVEIGINQVFLAEMQMLCPGDDRRAPVIIDHELGRRAFCHFERARPTRRCPPRDKSGQDTACQNGVPTTGVEGEAKSRASISPAS